MSRKASKLAGFMLVVVAALAFSLPSVASGAEKLNRSIYVPVQINLDGDFTQGVLYRGDEAIRSLPGKQVFQFTYYPELHKLVPEAQEFHIVAYREDGTSVDVGLVVTSCTVYIGKRSIALDVKKMLNHLRHRVDYHYDTVKLNLAGGGRTSDAASDESTQN
jgi:hypothetical protein